MKNQLIRIHSYVRFQTCGEKEHASTVPHLQSSPLIESFFVLNLNGETNMGRCKLVSYLQLLISKIPRCDW